MDLALKKLKKIQRISFRKEINMEFVPIQIKTMIEFHRRNAWLTYRKIDRRSYWFSYTWKLLTNDLNNLGPQHDEIYWMQVWDQLVVDARIASSFGDDLTENQAAILQLIFEHHPCPLNLQDEELMDGESLASTIPLEDQDFELNLVLELSFEEE